MRNSRMVKVRAGATLEVIRSVAAADPDRGAVMMSAIRTPHDRRPIAAHVYTVPIVRERPRPVIASAGIGTW
jgi:hypothetical protein